MSNDQKITPQRVFDAAWQAFVVEDRPPAQDCDVGLDGEPRWHCSYLTKDDKRCAFGLVIPDGHPALLMSTGARQVMESFPELFDGWEDARDAGHLQNRLHDGLASNGEWDEPYRTKESREFHYRQVAKSFGLTIPGEREGDAA